MKKINTLFTKVNKTNGRNGHKVEFIVIHYVGATGTAYDNVRYFENEYREASAHYFVSQNGDIWQCVEDHNTAWHCGDYYYGGLGGKYYGKCTNFNSIGIEMCVDKKDGKWIYNDATIESTAELVQQLMKVYDVPQERVIRHFDVSGKTCPAIYTDETKWKELKGKLTMPKTNNVAVVKYMASDRKEYYLNVYKNDTLEKLNDCVGYYNTILIINSKDARNCFTEWNDVSKVACGTSKGTKPQGTKIICKVVATVK